MRERERGRRPSGAALAAAAVCGAMIVALTGCGQSGPLYLPEKASLAASEPVRGSVSGAGGRPAAVRRAASARLALG